SPKRVRRSLSQWSSEGGEGWPSWAFSNHDAPRAVSRWASPENRKQAADLLMLLLLSLRGNAFIYQGEELGLPQAVVPFEHLKDPEAIANWPRTLGRDGARTPLPWISGAPNSGFSGGEPWLPVDPAHDGLAVDVQEGDAQSSLHVTRELVALRKSLPALRLGELHFVEAPEGVLSFERRLEGQSVSCVFNIGQVTASFGPPVGNTAHIIATQLGRVNRPVSLPAHIEPWTGYWAISGKRGGRGAD
ncbi:MAG: alpha-amylase family glycosyl hydrolase, partial [Henriciella sp.]|uniref:alpha-amylase family glycosyl hydrolase n=1 Tax=Henriciella sp. TaxID=1968823 RepID=UPI003C784AC2